MSIAFWKTKATLLIRAWMLVLMGLGALLLPTASSAQTPQQLLTWQKTIQGTLPRVSQPTCYQMTYSASATQWQPCPTSTMPLSAAPAIPAPSTDSAGGALQVGGIGGNYVASATGGPIVSATGSLPSLTGTLNPATYSLQINTNFLL